MLILVKSVLVVTDVEVIVLLSVTEVGIVELTVTVYVLRVYMN